MKFTPSPPPETSAYLFIRRIISPVTYRISRLLFNIKDKILTSEQTLRYIINNGVSISRYGDGELGIMRGQSIGFQDYDIALASRLREVAENPNDQVLVCIPGTMVTLDGLKQKPKKFWEGELGMKYFIWAYAFSKQRLLGDSLVSRYYIDWIDSISHANMILPLWKQIWDNRDLLIVEGKSSRLGVGNDIFNNAKSVSRILCPEKNAFDKYTQILRAVKQHYTPGMIVFVALGPTATVLSYDLAKEKIQTIDIGHIDIEYEWYRMRATEKVPIQSKATAEAGSATNIGESDDSEYLSQILCQIV